MLRSGKTIEPIGVGVASLVSILGGMDRDRSDTKTQILKAAYALFYAKGFARVSVDEISDRAGVTKRTVYYHFDSKDDVVAQALEVQHLHLMRQFQSWLGLPSDSPVEMLDNLFQKLMGWADSPDWLGSGFSRISAELADMRGHPARRAASRHKAAVEAWLAEQMADSGIPDAERKAVQIMVLIEGSMSLSLIHGDGAYFQHAGEAAKRIVGDQPDI